LRNRLFHRGISVLDIRPGFVDTPMTAQFGKSALWAQPADVAADILKAIDKQRDVIYTPWFWRWIMALIRAVPESIFKRLKL
jgi:decaprenylphospho-beta-D-erythro-pentofuranosid-2-ulose 2-reductase